MSKNIYEQIAEEKKRQTAKPGRGATSKTKRKPRKPKLTKVDGGKKEVRPVGRPPTGKRSDPDFKSVTIYLRKETHSAIRRVLFDQEGDTDMSDQIEELCNAWLKRVGKAVGQN